MTDSSSRGVTELLHEAQGGDSTAQARLYERVYGELRGLAKAQLGRNPGRSWQPTALVNEAFLRMVSPQDLSVADRSHFFATAVTVMRRVLVDHYRRQSSHKRGGDGARVTLHDADGKEPALDLDLLALDEALSELSAMDERKARVVELRFFGGLAVDEVAAALSVSKRTVEADWFFARAWLRSKLEGED